MFSDAGNSIVLSDCKASSKIESQYATSAPKEYTIEGTLKQVPAAGLFLNVFRLKTI